MVQKQNFMNCERCGVNIDILTSWKGLCYKCQGIVKYEAEKERKASEARA